jgi:lysophospholipase L1-like esterase
LVVASGVVVIGDSISAACSLDLAIGGVGAMTWAERIADTLGQPLTVHAKSGAATNQMISDLLPKLAGQYRIGLVYAGINNVLSARKERRSGFEADMETILRVTAEHADRVLVMTMPDALGAIGVPWAYGPAMRQRVDTGNRAIRAAAQRMNAEVIPAPDLGSDERVWSDYIHLTSLGHLAMADATMTVVDPAAARPSSRVEVGHISHGYYVWRKKDLRHRRARPSARAIAGWLIAR